MKRPGKILPLTLQQLVSKPATVTYPAGPRQFHDIRGKIIHNSDLCVGCTACTRDCPSKAIVIEKIDGVEKKYKAIINIGACVFCGQCVFGCPKKALHYTNDFELAVLSPDAMSYASPPLAPAEVPVADEGAVAELPSS